MTPPVISCFPVKLPAAPEPAALASAFAEATALAFGQPWRGVPEAAFRPGAVQTGWREGELLVFAELSDDDISNTARGLNDNTWEKGDVFEIFLRNGRQKEYLELHVTPDNEKFQLRIPSLEELVDRDRRHAIMEAFQIREEIFPTRAWVSREERRWQILAVVPFRELNLPERPVGAEILFSFSRYDYTRGAEAPVLSSTSSHEEPNFHRQHEWGRLTISDQPPVSG